MKQADATRWQFLRIFHINFNLQVFHQWNLKLTFHTISCSNMRLSRVSNDDKIVVHHKTQTKPQCKMSLIASWSSHFYLLCDKELLALDWWSHTRTRRSSESSNPPRNTSFVRVALFTHWNLISNWVTSTINSPKFTARLESSWGANQFLVPVGLNFSSIHLTFSLLHDRCCVFGRFFRL